MLPILGAQLEGALGDRDKWIVPNRTYHFPLRWDEIEKVPGVYTFPQWAFDTITKLNLKLGQSNYKLIIGVKCTPHDYSIPPHARNSPPSEIHYIDFAKFCMAVCDMFQPYAIEVWNEPEFTVAESAKNAEYYGGFGDDGLSYGKMVRVIYDYLQAKKTETKVISGASFGFVHQPRAFKFLSDAVKAGMKSHFWSWHGYKWYYNVVENTLAFRDFLRFSWDAQAIYNVPQILSEVSLMRVTELPESAEHRERQKELLDYLLLAKPLTNIESILWYTLANNGWRHTDLIMSGIEYPVYQVWKGEYQIYLPIVEKG
jgi:hypothetical protein